MYIKYLLLPLLITSHTLFCLTQQQKQVLAQRAANIKKRGRQVRRHNRIDFPGHTVRYRNNYRHRQTYWPCHVPPPAL